MNTALAIIFLSTFLFSVKVIAEPGWAVFTLYDTYLCDGDIVGYEFARVNDLENDCQENPWCTTMHSVEDGILFSMF